ncbi:hypothetical protein MBLNU457_4978t1 [Dothideomycetes sp. NU457]
MEKSTIQGLQQPTSKPEYQGATPITFFRDQLDFTTWLTLAALAQGLLFLVAGRVALIPAVAYLLFRIGDTYAIRTGLKRNHYRDGIIEQKHAALFPDRQGNYNKPGQEEVCVLHIGTRTNSPLGVLEPGFREQGDMFAEMIADIKAQAEEYGFLGSTTWTGNDRSSCNTLMTVMYFRNADDVHRYAHSPLHTKAWSWYYKTIGPVGNISIFHEIYQVSKGAWEAIYANMAPMGLGATQFKLDDGSYKGPLVDATKGVMRSARGRMAKTKGADNAYLGIANDWKSDAVENGLGAE